MQKKSNYFIIELKQAHIKWGTHRHTDSRPKIDGEGYLQIPADVARKFNITNSNSEDSYIYRCSSDDDFLSKVNLRATGSSVKGCIYAKQFQGDGDLKLIGNWFKHIKAKEGDKIKIEFIDTNEILLTKM